MDDAVTQIPSLQPLINKFAEDATPLNIVMFLFIVILVAWIWVREKRYVDVSTQLFDIATASIKAGQSGAEAARVSTEEARNWREELEDQRKSADYQHKTLERALDRIDRKGRT